MKSFFFHSILEIDRSAEQQATYCVVLYAFQFPLHTLGVAHEYGEYGVELTPLFFPGELPLISTSRPAREFAYDPI